MGEQTTEAPTRVLTEAFKELAAAETELQRLIDELEVGARADKVMISASLRTALSRVAVAKHKLRLAIGTTPA